MITELDDIERTWWYT